MRINTNVAALNSYNQLNKTNDNLSKSLERLSSGKRINGAADDAAGLAISEKMNSQTRGLAQAQRNAQDGISMIQTAEGALNESHKILQRMRELATQASNDSNTTSDRGEIQEEMNQLTSELNRIGNTTEFNTQKLLDGGGSSGVSRLDSTGLFENGSATSGETNYTQASQVLTAADAQAQGDLDGTSLNFTVQGDQDITINFEQADLGVETGDDGVIQVDNDSVTENSITVQVDTSGGGTATTENITDTDLASIIKEAGNKVIQGNENLEDNYSFYIGTDTLPTGDYTDDTASTANQITLASLESGEYSGSLSNISATTDVAAVTGAGDAAVGSTENLQSSFDIDFSGVTDVTSLDELKGSGFTVDGMQFEFYDSSEGTYTGGANGISLSSVDTTGTINEEVADTVASQLNNYLADEDNINSVEVDFDRDGDGTGEGADVVSIVASAAGEDGNSTIDVQDGGKTESFSAQFQIGANTAQSLKLSIGDMRANSLGVSGNQAGATIDVGDGLEAAFTKVQNVTDGTTDIDREFALDVSSHENATAAISVLDDAIAKVSSQRSELGAVQNRLDHTINNLNTSEENLTAAESRISDVDMAREMMNMSKQQILSQAGTAMMAQANQLPQGVLQLLG